MSRPACIISCDIIGHARERQCRGHLEELRSLNLAVKHILDDVGNGKAAWASRGDGGHIVLYAQDWQQIALDSIAALQLWSKENLAPLRIIAHYGLIETFEGADGRPEFAGDSINLVGRIAQLASDRQVVVTKHFKDCLEELGSEQPVFRDEFVLDTDDFGPVGIFFLSLSDDLESPDHSETSADITLLAAALRRNASWKVIYHAKRLLELNDNDPDALSALRSLTKRDLAFVNRDTGSIETNPIFESLNKPQTAQFIQAAQLVERRAGETICTFGAPGDTMYIILNGAVGVILPGDTRPTFLLRSGEIVGELAFKLHQPRTATLRCLSQTSLLSFNPRNLQAILSQSPSGRSALSKIHEFLKARVLRYICREMTFLVGPDGSGPLASVPEPWEEIGEYAEIFEIAEDPARPVLMGGNEFAAPGIYILLAGKLMDCQNPSIRKELGLSVLHWDVPGRFVKSKAEYTITEDIVVMHIGADAFSSFADKGLTREVWTSLEKYLVYAFTYDVFLSYAGDDKDKALRWRERLRKEGWNIFMDEMDEMKEKYDNRIPEPIASSIRESLFFVPLISGNVMGKDAARNWVKWEIEKRKEMFDLNRANIIPIQLSSVDVRELIDGFKIVDGSGGNEDDALEEVVRRIARGRWEGRVPLAKGGRG